MSECAQSQAQRKDPSSIRWSKGFKVNEAFCIIFCSFPEIFILLQGRSEIEPFKAAILMDSKKKASLMNSTIGPTEWKAAHDETVKVRKDNSSSIYPEL